jgi:ribose 5-phosphate isomerase RpiB
MKIAIGCDQRGFGVKTKLMELGAAWHEVTDAGSFSRQLRLSRYRRSVAEK